MHRRVRDEIESVLGDSRASEARGSQDRKIADVLRHAEQCAECSAEIAAMRGQAGLLRALRAPAEIEPRAGFYARVLERIEAQGPVSIWNSFLESALARRVAMASAVFALLIGVYLVSFDRMTSHSIVITNQSDWALTGGMPDPAESPDRDAVLVNLVTYREQ